MNVLTSQIKNESIMQKDLFRFAATLFSENSDIYSVSESQLQLVKCIYFEKFNEYLSISDLVTELLRVYKYHISEEELITIIKKHRKIFQSIEEKGEYLYKLTDRVYSEIIVQQENNINSYIETYIKQEKIANSDICKNAINKYLYELTTSNINSYKVLISGKDSSRFKESELSINMSFLTEEELTYVHGFIEWNNNEKNIALSNIVFSCLEYCLLVNGDKPNRLLINKIRKREIYLDTNILFRAIGINGHSNQRVVISFLKKCKQAKLKLVISHQTKIEFNDTIAYYLSEISKYPRGNIYQGAYEQLSDYKLFSLYEEWRAEHPNLSLKFFEIYIRSQYDLMVQEYDIKDDEVIPSKIYNSESFKNRRNEYVVSISKSKQEAKPMYLSEDYHYSKRDGHDATIISYIEELREEGSKDVDVFLVSSDKILRFWDMDRREHNYPIVIYPSQLFLVLIKMCGRSDKDFESFVSFINVKSTRKQITAEKANIILSGISSITNDIETQRLIVSSICDGDFQNVISDSNADEELYQKVRTISQRYLEDELNEQKEAIVELKETTENQQVQIDNLKGMINKQNNTINNQALEILKSSSNTEELKERICRYAEKRILIPHIIKWFILPIVAIIIVMFFITSIVLQFTFCDASWNYVTKLFDFVSNTTFGKNVDGYMAVIDGAAFVILGTIILPAIWVKPWNKEKREEDKQKMIEHYINKHALL